MTRMAAPSRPGGTPRPAVVLPSAIAEALAFAVALRTRGIPLRVVEGRLVPGRRLRDFDRADLARHERVLAALLDPARTWPAAVAKTDLQAMLERVARAYPAGCGLAGTQAWAVRRESLDRALVASREANDLVRWCAAIFDFEAWARAELARWRAARRERRTG